MKEFKFKKDAILDHGLPKTRREAIARGFITGGGAILAPSMLSLLTSKAYGACLPPAAAGGNLTGRMGVISFHLAGGLPLAQNAVIGGPGGLAELVSANGYASMGVPQAISNAQNIDRSLGLPFWNNSPILAGIKMALTPAAQAVTNGAILAVRSADDSNQPQFGGFGHRIITAGAKGSVAAMLGTRNGPDGGRYQALQTALTSTTPVLINNPADARGLVQAGLLANILNNANATKILQDLEVTSDQKLGAFLSKSHEAQFRELIKCRYNDARVNLASNMQDAIDIAQDAALLAIANTANNSGITFDNSTSVRNLQITKMVLEGYSAFGAIEVGGCDDHGNNAARQISKRFEVGTHIGKTLQAAFVKNQPLMVTVFTDGSQAATGEKNATLPGGMPFLGTNSDNGERSAAIVFIIKPGSTTRPAIEGGNQRGAFQTANGAVDQTSAPFANSPALAADYLGNVYLELIGQKPQFSLAQMGAMTATGFGKII